jgi:hypothetical protein
VAAHSTKTKDEVQRALLLDVVVGEGAAVLQLLAREDEALLVGGDALLVLDLSLDGVDGVGGLDFEGDGCYFCFLENVAQKCFLSLLIIFRFPVFRNFYAVIMVFVFELHLKPKVEREGR